LFEHPWKTEADSLPTLHTGLIEDPPRMRAPERMMDPRRSRPGSM
jgi:hypothetical protein